MRYLRMLSNSAFAGLLAAVYLTLLVLHLNPSVPLDPSAVGPLLGVFVITYGAHIFVTSYALYVLRQIAISEPSSPGWISLRLLTWSAAILSATAGVMTWLHAVGLRTTLEPASLPRVRNTAFAFLAAAGVFLALGVAQFAARRRSRALVAVLFSIATIASIVVPLLLRGAPLEVRVPESVAVEGPRVQAPRVTVLCIGGASLDHIAVAVASGRLPNFGRILDGGASMHLATTRPTQPESSWASVFTGKWPALHGVRGTARYQPYSGGATLDVLPDYLFSEALVRFGFLKIVPYESRSLRARPLWLLVDRRLQSVAVIGMPLTYPAQPVNGLIVSDRWGSGNAELAAGPFVYPAAMNDALRLVASGEGGDTFGITRRAVEPSSVADAIDGDRARHRIATQLPAASQAQFRIVRYMGIDAIGHYYLRYAEPGAVRDVSEEDRRTYGRVLDDYYADIDSVVGEALSTLQGDDILLVVSAFGMEPLTVPKRLLEQVLGDPRLSGSHERAPDGFAMAFGAPIAAGRMPRGSVVDIAPTLLYFLGLPVGRDMEGFVRTDMFTRAFNAPRTITFIPAYDH